MNTNTLKSQLQQAWRSAVHLRILLFLVVLVVLYAFIGLRIQTLSSAEPDAAEVASKASTTSKPYIDKTVIDQVKQLQENSTTAKALFDEARQNPFRE